MKKWILAVTLAAQPLSSTALAQSKDVLSGTWKLISFVSTTDKGEVKDLMGQKDSSPIRGKAGCPSLSPPRHASRSP
jgi:hypothetical protein